MLIWTTCLLLPFRIGPYCSPVQAHKFLGREVHQRPAAEGGRHLRDIRCHTCVLSCRRQVQELQVVRQREPFELYQLTMSSSE